MIIQNCKNKNNKNNLKDKGIQQLIKKYTSSKKSNKNTTNSSHPSKKKIPLKPAEDIFKIQSENIQIKEKEIEVKKSVSNNLFTNKKRTPSHCALDKQLHIIKNLSGQPDTLILLDNKKNNSNKKILLEHNINPIYGSQRSTTTAKYCPNGDNENKEEYLKRKQELQSPLFYTGISNNPINNLATCQIKIKLILLNGGQELKIINNENNEEIDIPYDIKAILNIIPVLDEMKKEAQCDMLNIFFASIYRDIIFHSNHMNNIDDGAKLINKNILVSQNNKFPRTIINMRDLRNNSDITPNDDKLLFLIQKFFSICSLNSKTENFDSYHKIVLESLAISNNLKQYNYNTILNKKNDINPEQLLEFLRFQLLNLYYAITNKQTFSEDKNYLLIQEYLQEQNNSFLEYSSLFYELKDVLILMLKDCPNVVVLNNMFHTENIFIQYIIKKTLDDVYNNDCNDKNDESIKEILIKTMIKIFQGKLYFVQNYTPCASCHQGFDELGKIFSKYGALSTIGNFAINPYNKIRKISSLKNEEILPIIIKLKNLYNNPNIYNICIVMEKFCSFSSKEIINNTNNFFKNNNFLKEFEKKIDSTYRILAKFLILGLKEKSSGISQFLNKNQYPILNNVFNYYKKNDFNGEISKLLENNFYYIFKLGGSSKGFKEATVEVIYNENKNNFIFRIALPVDFITDN